jgi:hypothetical protein
MGKKPGSGSYFRELRKSFLGLKYLKFFDADRDGKNSDPGSGIRDGKKFGSEIRDKNPGSAILNINLLERISACAVLNSTSRPYGYLASYGTKK